tara:strand:+ start:495 stop:833 length:339 start_codon:yes stop_codon:yes gene_type:complete
LNKALLEIVEKELKIFYFKAFKRRSKSLETLDLIQECYSDQISLFNEYLERLLKSFKEKRTKSLLIEDLIKFKNLEGCNKKIMKSLIAEIKKIDHSINFDSVENKYLFEFDD